jgi:hypothetical protein
VLFLKVQQAAQEPHNFLVLARKAQTCSAQAPEQVPLWTLLLIQETCWLAAAMLQAQQELVPILWQRLVLLLELLPQPAPLLRMLPELERLAQVPLLQERAPLELLV